MRETFSGLNKGNRIYMIEGTQYYQYSTLLHGISGTYCTQGRIFPEAEGQGKYSLLTVQYICTDISQGRVAYI